MYLDVLLEQARAGAAQLVVLLHPIQWDSMPALMKLWLDEVLTYGWAYGSGTALRGKDLWLVATTGGSEKMVEWNVASRSASERVERRRVRPSPRRPRAL